VSPRLVVTMLVALALAAGCGGEPERVAAPPVPQGDFGPTEPGSGPRKRPVAPPLARPSAAVASALAGGAVGVVGVEGDIGVRPRSLEVSADGTLEGLEWASWTDRSAEGQGRLRLRDCNPTCANGSLDSLDATVRLSQPRLCEGATYFDRAEVTIPGAEPPTTYVRAPC
jgi:hypothetical protein